MIGNPPKVLNFNRLFIGGVIYLAKKDYKVMVFYMYIFYKIYRLQ